VVDDSMFRVSTMRLYVMRAFYLLVFVGQGFIQTPRIVHHLQSLTFTFWDGIATSFLASLALLAAVGIRYPLKMVVLLVFELTWKAVWLLSVALPLWLADRLDADTIESLPSILLVIVVPFVIPWRYVFAKLADNTRD
jgi:hypothetical protein